MITFFSLIRTAKTAALLAVLIIFTQNLTAQRRGTTYTPAPPPFEVNQVQLNSIIKQLENALSCQSAFDQVESMVITQQELEDFIQQTQKDENPIRPEAITVYLNFTDALKNELKGYYGHIKSIKVIRQIPRYGQSSNMKIVGLYLHLVLPDDSLLPLRLQLLEYNGRYELFTLDS